MSSGSSSDLITLTHRQFTDAVTEATDAAVRSVLSATRKERMLLAGVVAALITLAIAIPTTIALNGQDKSTIHTNAQRNCEAVASTRPQGNARAFVQKITVELAEDAFRQFPVKFQHAEVERINAALRAEKLAGGELPTRIHGLDELGAIIRPVPLLNCNTLVKD